MFAALEEINRRPAPFEAHTADALWTDDHLSARMLAYHLDPEEELASRGRAFVERSAAWLVDRLELADGVRVVDFGCGPGQYAGVFARAGASVTGIDISARSIAHARGEATAKGLYIEYVEADYLAPLPVHGRFDVATLIYCDLCALGPDRRAALLANIRRHLNPGGMLALDVFSTARFEEVEEGAVYEYRLMDGFWAPGPYYGFLNVFRWDELALALDKYTIVEPARTRTFLNWIQHFDDASLTAELEAAGFAIEDRFADLAGTPQAGGDEEIAVIARAVG